MDSSSSPIEAVDGLTPFVSTKEVVVCLETPELVPTGVGAFSDEAQAAAENSIDVESSTSSRSATTVALNAGPSPSIGATQ